MADEKPTHEIISRKEARARGLRTYFTGAPCAQGHIAIRSVYTCVCWGCNANRVAKWRAINPLKEKETKRAWLAANKEKMREWSKLWRAENVDRVRQGKRNAKAKRKLAEGSHSAEDVSDILKMQRRRCAYCREKVGEDRHVDHIVPMARGGSNRRNNLQILCAPCNLSKAAKDPITFSQQLGMLL